MLASKTFDYQFDDITYEVIVIYKHIRNIHYRFKDNHFEVTCSRWVSLKTIKSGLDKYASKLIKRTVKKPPIGEDYIYIFGEKHYLSFPGEFTFLNETFTYKNMDDFHKKIKKLFLKYLTYKNEYYREEMNAPKYQVKIRDMKSRYGSNNRKSKTITYAFMLIHHTPDVIDSVIMHELTHCFVFNHSDNFYHLLYKYCPNYNILRKKLIKTEFN